MFNDITHDSIYLNISFIFVLILKISLVLTRDFSLKYDFRLKDSVTRSLVLVFPSISFLIVTSSSLFVAFFITSFSSHLSQGVELISGMFNLSHISFVSFTRHRYFFVHSDTPLGIAWMNMEQDMRAYEMVNRQRICLTNWLYQ